MAVLPAIMLIFMPFFAAGNLCSNSDNVDVDTLGESSSQDQCVDRDESPRPAVGKHAVVGVIVAVLLLMALSSLLFWCWRRLAEPSSQENSLEASRPAEKTAPCMTPRNICTLARPVASRLPMPFLPKPSRGTTSSSGYHHTLSGDFNLNESTDISLSNYDESVFKRTIDPLRQCPHPGTPAAIDASHNFPPAALQWPFLNATLHDSHVDAPPPAYGSTRP